MKKRTLLLITIALAISGNLYSQKQLSKKDICAAISSGDTLLYIINDSIVAYTDDYIIYGNKTG